MLIHFSTHRKILCYHLNLGSNPFFNFGLNTVTQQRSAIRSLGLQNEKNPKKAHEHCVTPQVRKTLIARKEDKVLYVKHIKCAVEKEKEDNNDQHCKSREENAEYSAHKDSFVMELL